MWHKPVPQEKFLKLVEIQEEKKEQVKLRCWAGWATEEKMKEELKFSPNLPMHIKSRISYCDMQFKDHNILSSKNMTCRINQIMHLIYECHWALHTKEQDHCHQGVL